MIWKKKNPKFLIISYANIIKKSKTKIKESDETMKNLIYELKKINIIIE